MSYAALLETPHQERYAGAPAAPLQEATVEAETSLILEHVRRALHFQQEWTHSNVFSPEAIASRQTTDCLGYVAVASELLVESDIPHYIGYVNAHFYIGLSHTLGSQYYMATVENHKVNGVMDPYLAVADARKLEPTIEQYGRGAARFDTARYVLDELGYRSYDDHVYEGMAPWTHRAHQVTLSDRGTSVASPRFGSITTTFFTPELGLQMLEDKARLNYAYGNKDYRQMADVLAGMGICYPEANTQPSAQWLPKKIIRTLLTADTVEVDLALAVNDSIYSALAISGDSRALLLHAQQLSEIAYAAKSKAYSLQAIEEYDQALADLRPTRAYEGMREKALGYAALI